LFFPDGIPLEDLKTKVFGEHYSDPVWKEVLCLLMGMLSAEFTKEIAEELINSLIDMEETYKKISHLFLAADCYGELRNQSIYVELSQRLLNSLQSLTKLSYSYADTDFKEKPVSKIGNIWQDDPTGWSVLQAIAIEQNYWDGAREAVNQLSRIAKIHSEALAYLQEVARQGESKAIKALVTHWRDNPQTLPIIQQQANKGESEAIEALANHWRDNPQTLPIIQQQANKGKSKAIEALVTHWRDNPQTLPIIQQQANKGEREIIELLRGLSGIKIDSDIGAIIKTILARKDLDSDIKERFRELLMRNNFRELRNPDQDSQHERGGGGHFSTLRTKIGGHFSTLRTKITDAEILVKSLQDLGIIVKREADVRGSSSQRVRVDIVAVLEGDYDLGWIRNTDGSFDLIIDLLGVAKKHDQTELINSINAKYAVNKTLKEIKERGLN